MRAFADLPYRGGEHRRWMTERLDPYYTGAWDVSRTAVWLSRTDSERYVAAGLSKPTMEEERRTEAEAVQALTLPGRYAELATLAAVGAWRTITVEQIAALTGARVTKRMQEILWATGLIARGRMQLGVSAKTPMLMRPTQSSDFGLLADRLRYVDWLGVTGGLPWLYGSQADRHNLLAVEVALRAAEYTPIAAILGDAYSKMTRFFPPVTQVPSFGPWTGDGVIVRSDGLRIALELTATASVSLGEKFERWASFLARDTTSSTAVLFVEARHPGLRSKYSDRAVLNRIRRMMAQAATSTMGRIQAGVPERMLMVSWTEWFPQPGHVCDDYVGLPVWRPTGRADSPEGRYERVSLLDPFEVAGPSLDRFPDGSTPRAVVANSKLLYASPHWLRQGSAPDPRSVVALHSTGGIPGLVSPYDGGRARLAARAMKGKVT